MINVACQRWISALVASLLMGTARAQNADDTLSFYSRPDLTPPALHVAVSEEGVTPGYIFMSPYQAEQNSAVIYDTDGELVWSGYGLTGGGLVHAVHVCDYIDTPHICFFNGEQGLGYARGHVEIMNTNLTAVAAVRAQNGISNLDMHENHLTRDGKAMFVTSYHPERYDLSDFNITTGLGWIQNCIVQKIDVATSTLLWEWSAIEHVPLAESYVLPNSTEVAGTGFSPTSPWDYVHVNSADENEDGDVLVSARHVNTVFKVSGHDGRVIWRLGGRNSDFDMGELVFSSQHDARWKSSNASTEILSLFDNASNGFQSTAEESSGMIIKLDHSTDPPRATLLKTFPAPENQTISASQGNLQLLGDREDWDSSNAFIGWGSQPVVTEHLPDGTIVFQASVTTNGPMNYRAFKYNLTTNPTDNPALYTYAPSTDSGLTVFYMSWNGATEVAFWRLYGRGSCDGRWLEIDTVTRDGFETICRADDYYEFGMVEALDADRNGLRNSSTRGTKTFVPKNVLAKYCDRDGCDIAEGYVEGDGHQVVIDTNLGCSALVSNETSSGNEGENAAFRRVAGSMMLLVSTIGLVLGLILI
ncbi:hypothetical protein RBB50_003693 [Rhinocladiella similis]